MPPLTAHRRARRFCGTAAAELLGKAPRARRWLRGRPRGVQATRAHGRFLCVAVLLTWMSAGAVLAERLPFRTYTVSDGLGSDSVRALLEDSRGFLWIGTSAGLSRFDGTEFRTYDNKDGLPGSRIDGLFESSAGELWVSTSSGAARLDPLLASDRAFVPVSLPGKATYVDCLFEDGARHVWVGVGSTLYRLDRPGQALTEASTLTLAEGEIAGMGAADAEGGLWLATSRGLRRILADGSRRLYPVIASMDNVRAMARDAAGRIWLGTGDSIYVFQPERATTPAPADVPLAERARAPAYPGDLPRHPGEVVRYHSGALSSPFVDAIEVAGDGAIVVATHSGVVRFAGGGMRVLSAEQGLPERSILSVLEDRDGRLWAGSESRGLARLEPAGFVTYGRDDGLSDERISAAFEDPTGHLFAVTNGRELHVFDGRRFENVTPPAVAAAIGGWGWNDYTLRDHLGGWWFPTSRGLFRFAPVAAPRDLLRARPIARLRGGHELAGDDVFRLFEDRRGDVWVSTIARPPLLRLPARGAPVIERPLHGDETGGTPSAFAEDAEGDVWVGFYSGGLARVRAGEWRFFDAGPAVPPGFVEDLHLDRAGRLWVATGAGGIARIDAPASDAPRFVRFTTAEGLSTDSTRCITDDERGRIYVGHERGVDRLDLASGAVRRFSAEDGLSNTVLRTCTTLRDGSLWFGTVHGLARLEPAHERSARAPAVLISGLRANGVAYPVPGLGAQEIAYWLLPPSDGAVEIDFIGLEVGSAPLRFEVRLDGRDGAWSEPRPARSVVFPRLGPGRYRFEVRALSADGLTSVQPASVAFEIQAPLWRRPAMQALALVALGLLAWWGYRARVRRLLALERVRMRIASDLHDDVGASLSRIGLLGELARARLESEPRAASAMLERIGEEAGALTEATADIIWAVDPRRDDLGSLIVRLRRFAADLLEAKGVRLHVEVPEEAEGLALPAEVRRALYLMLKESFHNIAKHAQARAAWLRVTVTAHEVIAAVRDDGVGIDVAAAAAAASSGRRGLPGLRERAAAVGGSVAIESTASGTTITLRVPRRPVRPWRRDR